MEIKQVCASCSGVYFISGDEHNKMGAKDRVYCSACGHPNKKQSPLATKNPARRATIFSWTQSSMPMIQEDNWRFTEKKRLTTEELRQLTTTAGRVFVIGDHRSLNRYDLGLIRGNYPVIGIQNAYKYYPVNAVVIGEKEYIKENLLGFERWQNDRNSLCVFWMRHEEKLHWRSNNRKHGYCVDDDGKVIFNKTVGLKNCNVQYFNPVDDIQPDLKVPVKLKYNGDLTISAINLAYQLGAREIVLLGMDPKKAKDIEKIRDELDQFGCKVISGTKLGNITETCFEEAAANDIPYYLQKLKERIQYTGRCFLMGAGPSLNKLNLGSLVGWPVISANTGFMRYPLADALIFGDAGFIQNQLVDVVKWQKSREEKPLIFFYDTDHHPKLCRVVKWLHASENPVSSGPFRQPLQLSIKRSIITPAIDLAYQLCAKEIYLLGVDLDNDAHFWDEEEEVALQWGKPVGRFPGGREIADFLEWQYKALQARNIKLATCYDGGLLKGKVPYVSIEEATDPHKLNQNPCFGGQKKYD